MWVCWLYIFKVELLDKDSVGHKSPNYHLLCAGHLGWLTKLDKKRPFLRDTTKNLSGVFTLIDAATMLSICGAEVKLAYYLLTSFSGKTEGNPLSQMSRSLLQPHFAHTRPLQIWIHRQQWLVLELGRQGILDHSLQPLWKMQVQAFVGCRDRDPISDQGSHSQALRLRSKSLQWGPGAWALKDQWNPVSRSVCCPVKRLETLLQSVAALVRSL